MDKLMAKADAMCKWLKNIYIPPIIRANRKMPPLLMTMWIMISFRRWMHNFVHEFHVVVVVIFRFLPFCNHAIYNIIDIVCNMLCSMSTFCNPIRSSAICFSEHSIQATELNGNSQKVKPHLPNRTFS